MVKLRKNTIIILILAMILQIVLPVVSDVVSAESTGKAFRADVADTEVSGTKIVSWKFDFSSSSGQTRYVDELGLKLESEKDGKLKVDDNTVIGQYTISEDGKITVDIDENLEEIVRGLLYGTDEKELIEQELESEPVNEPEEESEGSSEKTEIEDTEVQETEKQEDDSEETPDAQQEDTELEPHNSDIPEITVGKPIAQFASTSDAISIPLDNEKEEITYTFKGSFKVDGVVEEDEGLLGIQELALLSEGKDLGNIFKNAKVTVDDNEVTNGSIIDITDKMEVKIHYDWELPNDDGDFILAENDYAITKLPDVLKAINPTAGGKLLDGDKNELGTYSFEDGNLKVVFNDFLVGKEGRSGDVWFSAEFDLEEFKENVIQEIEFEDIIEPITIKVNPENKLGIINKRVNLDADINATEIYWEIDVNSSLDSLTNATLEDTIPEGLSLKNDSIEVYNLLIGYEGKITEGSKADFTGVVTDTGFKVEFGKIDTAYRIKYTTTIDDYSKAPYENAAVIKDDDVEKGNTSATNVIKLTFICI